MPNKVFIDGSAGTTGLQIYDRLAARGDIEMLTLDEAHRKHPAARAEALNAADIVFLCLPDDAAREAVSLIQNDRTRVIDASTAHRTAPGWVYGLPELSAAQRAAIQGAKRVANPGCHATGFITIAAPLIAAGLLAADAELSCFSLTGYSGGGKKMIAEYETDKTEKLYAPSPYGLHQQHKHLPEMQSICGLDRPPVFLPVVDDYYKGMATTVPLPGLGAKAVWQCLKDHYAGQKLVTVAELDAVPSLYANAMAGRDSLILYVSGHDDRTAVTALFDNLGKGASGAAVQNMNLMLGLPEETGLTI